MIIYVLAFVIFLYFCYHLTSPTSPHSKFAKQIGGPKGYPVVGNALEIIKNLNRTLVTLANWVDQYGDRLVFFVGPSAAFLINNPEDVEKVCISTEMITKSVEYDMIREWLGDGLITSKGQHWAQRRKLITPCFHFSILEKYVAPINTHAAVLVDILKENFEGKSEYIDINEYIAKCTLDIICETSMGIQMNSQNESASEYVAAVQRMGQLFQYRSIRPWLRINFLWNLTSQRREEVKMLKIIHSFTDKVIADRKRCMQLSPHSEDDENAGNEDITGGKKKKALLDLLLEAQQKDQQSISDEGIREETTTFIFAGHDTVSIAVSFCLYCLGCHPTIQARVHEELDSILGKDLDKPVTSIDIRNLKYLEFCLKESLRMFPSAPLLGREVIKPFKLDANTIVPAGVGLYLFPYKLHRNPKYYSKPNEYIPERFDPTNEEFVQGAVKSPFAYIPFSAGQRNCMGQKLAMIKAKIVLAKVLKRFTVKSEKKLEELEVLSEIVLRVKGGLGMKLQCR